MAEELTAIGVRVYRDTGGVLREIPQVLGEGGGGGAVLPDTFKVSQEDAKRSIELNLTQLGAPVVSEDFDANQEAIGEMLANPPLDKVFPA